MYEKVLSILKKAQNENNYLKKNYQQKSSRNQSYENAKICYIYKEKLKNKYLKDKNFVKLQIIVIIQENVEVLHIAHVI